MKKHFLSVVLMMCFCSVTLAQQGSTEQLAIEFLNNGETEKAIQLFEEVYSRTPSPHIYRLYLDALLQLRNTRDAERLVRRHQRNFPQSPTTAVDLGHVFLVSGDKAKADREFTAIIDRLPNNQSQIIEIAIALFDRRQTEFAIQAFVKGRQNLNNPQAFARDLATLYERADRMADMTNEYLLMIEHNPNLLSLAQQRIQVIIANDTDKKASSEIRKTILDHIQRNPQSRIAQEFWISLLLSTEEFDTALTFARAYDRRFNDDGRKVLEVAQIAQNSMSKIAEQAYQYVITKGNAFPYYFQARMGLLSYYYQLITSSVVVDINALLALEKQYEELLSNLPLSTQTIRLVRDWARISAFYNNNFEKADSLLNMALNIRNLPRNLAAEIKLDLADIYLFTGEVWESTLLYSQVEKEFKHDEIGFDAKLRNARLSYFIGEFEWALAQLDVLRAATSKLIANDAMELSLLIRENMDDGGSALTLFAHADLLIYQRKYDEALRFFDSITSPLRMINAQPVPQGLHSEILMKRAEIALKSGDPNEALIFLENIFTHHAHHLLADDALFLAARINEEELNLPFIAMALYEQLILEHPSSLFVPEARRRFRELRGF